MQILGFSPSEGESRAPISVRIRFTPQYPFQIHLRLVFGHIAVSTNVCPLSGDEWLLEATTPDREDAEKVPLTIQVLDDADTILDSLTFGKFTYWISKRSPTPEDPTFSRHRCVRGPHDARLSLEIITPLESMCENWDQTEIRAGRRLVKFNKIQDGSRLILTCEAIRPQDFDQSDTVISCIRRDENACYYFTSVDIIYLLEQLTNDDFPVEEKNRIRRNLEAFRPTPVSKNKPDYELFFQRIMNFADPKPRNIQKNLKVFEWALLGQALEKILSKYSIVSSSTESNAPLLGNIDTDDDTKPI